MQKQKVRIVKLKKIFIILFLFLIILLCFSTNTKAFGDIVNGNTLANPLNSVQLNNQTVLSAVGWIIKVIQIISVLAAIISLILIGIQYIMGSVEQKAADKKKINTLLIGILFMSSVMAIVSFIFESFKQII